MNLMQRAGRVPAPVLVLIAGAWFSGGVAPTQDEARKNTRYPQQILVIRHAEKTGDKGDVHLSKQGQKRAEVLYQLFLASKDRPDSFPTPDFIFAASDATDSRRPVETVTPLAMKLKLPIIDTCTSKLPAGPSPNLGKNQTEEVQGMLGLRDELFGEPKYFGKTILVSWRHKTIANLAQTLKASKVPTQWPDDVFDRVWQIAYDDKGNATFADRPQRLLPGDAEK
jgi:hypothetical protein